MFRSEVEGVSRAVVTAASAGQLAILIAVCATLLAGREALDVLFIAGFALEIVGVLVTALILRRVLVGALAPGLVVALVLFSSAGAAVLGAIWLALAARRFR